MNTPVLHAIKTNREIMQQCQRMHSAQEAHADMRCTRLCTCTVCRAACARLVCVYVQLTAQLIQAASKLHALCKPNRFLP